MISITIRIENRYLSIFNDDLGEYLIYSFQLPSKKKSWKKYKLYIHSSIVIKTKKSHRIRLVIYSSPSPSPSGSSSFSIQFISPVIKCSIIELWLLCVQCVFCIYSSYSISFVLHCISSKVILYFLCVWSIITRRLH